MRLAALFLAVALTGCISAASQRDGGIATYDAIRAASKSCHQKNNLKSAKTASI